MEQFDRAQMARRFAEIRLQAYANENEDDLERYMQDIVKHAFDLADAMLAEENKRKSNNG